MTVIASISGGELNSTDIIYLSDCGMPCRCVKALLCKTANAGVMPDICVEEANVFRICLPACYEDLEQNDVRVQYLWEALTNFTNGQSTRSLHPQRMNPSSNLTL